MQTGYVHAFQFPDGRSFHLFQGSLAEVRADALVSSDDNQLSAGGGVSAALARVAGPVVAMERYRLASGERPLLGGVVRTSGGGLPCRHLYHAITIDFDHGSIQDEGSLRRLVANLLDRATEDGVTSIGLPALGTGAAGFPLGRASEILIEELLAQIHTSPIMRVVLALVGDVAERLFYENLVRGSGRRLAAEALRERNLGIDRTTEAKLSARFFLEDQTIGDRVVEQMPSLADERQLKKIGTGRPRLVSGLSDLILRYASEAEVEQELLSRPECFGFCGTVAQRLMEFLYLSEEKLRLALGPALFRTKDLRSMAGELELGDVGALGHDELATAILRELGFNIVAPPLGALEAIRRVEQLSGTLKSAHPDEQVLRSAVQEAGRILERFLLDLLKVYSGLFWGENAEEELAVRGLVPRRREGASLHRLTLGQLREAIGRLSGLIREDRNLRIQWERTGRRGDGIFGTAMSGATGSTTEVLASLQSVIDARNVAAHGSEGSRAWILAEVVALLETLAGFCTMSRREGIYPEVLRYEGAFENRHGERFLHFLDESGQQRMVRSDEAIDPRRHYFCFATNNPVHLFPVLVPKD